MCAACCCEKWVGKEKSNVEEIKQKTKKLFPSFKPDASGEGNCFTSAETYPDSKENDLHTVFHCCPHCSNVNKDGSAVHSVHTIVVHALKQIKRRAKSKWEQHEEHKRAEEIAPTFKRLQLRCYELEAFIGTWGRTLKLALSLCFPLLVTRTHHPLPLTRCGDARVKWNKAASTLKKLYLAERSEGLEIQFFFFQAQFHQCLGLKW